MCLAAFVAMLAARVTAQAQGVPGGAVHGFNEGARIAGPVGAVDPRKANSNSDDAVSTVHGPEADIG
jgi:hypothetical protein